MRKFIIKVDDLRLNQDIGRYLKLVDICQRRQAPCSIGVIGSQLQGGRFADQRRLAGLIDAGTIEVWNHGFYHRDLTVLPPAEVAWEIAQTNSECQKALGVLPTGFGAPFNRWNADTEQAALALNLGFTYEQLVPRRALVTPENNAPLDGQPSFATFRRQVERRQDAPFLVIQVHPARWQPAGFAVFAECLDWLLQLGYTAITGSAAARLTGVGAAPAGPPLSSHDHTVRELGGFWQERAADYNGHLANFSSYFLARFAANSPGIKRLLTSLDADLGCRAMADVGCGLAQWALPFAEFNPHCEIHAFDLNPVIGAALQAAGQAGLLPGGFAAHSEDFVTSTALAAGRLDLITCANALNYMPVAAFAAQAQRLCSSTGRVILLNQTGAFNQAGFAAARATGNLAMAKERALAELRQYLVRQGLAGFAPPRQTLAVAELEAVFWLHGFTLRDRFVPDWEADFAGAPTFQGLGFVKAGSPDPTKLTGEARRALRKTLCRAGYPELDSSRFAAYPADLADPELYRLKLRGGALGPAVPADPEARLSSLAAAGKWRQIQALAGAAAGADPVVQLAGFVASLKLTDLAGAERSLAALLGQPADPVFQLAAELFAMLAATPGAVASTMAPGPAGAGALPDATGTPAPGVGAAGCDLSVVIPLSGSGPRATEAAGRLAACAAPFVQAGAEVVVAVTGPALGVAATCAELGLRYLELPELPAQQAFSVGPVRNAAVAAARGRCLYFLDVDVYHDPATASTICQRAAKLGPEELVMVPVLYLGRRLTAQARATELDCARQARRFLAGEFAGLINLAAMSSALLVRRELFVRAGGFNAAFAGHGGEDLELVHRLACLLEGPVWTDGTMPRQDVIAESTGLAAALSAYGIKELLDGLCGLHLRHEQFERSAYRRRRQVNRQLLASCVAANCAQAQANPGRPGRDSRKPGALAAEIDALLAARGLGRADAPGLFMSQWQQVALRERLLRKLNKLRRDPAGFWRDSPLGRLLRAARQALGIGPNAHEEQA